ncbi:MAG TPA: peptide chain release factor N(5)-glutamine methyltransferase [Gaiellaceae bacterium]
MNLAEALRAATEYLRERGVPSPRNDAELLLAGSLALGRAQLYSEHDRELTDPEHARFDELVERRGHREPLAYVLGTWGFRRLTLKVDARVLVPRPETEIVVEHCLELIRALDRPRVLDVGTGSGAIALAIADEHPGARVTAIDSSSAALELAAENVAATGLGARLRLVEHDFHAGLALGGVFDLVVSNPPYVRPDEIESLEPEVRDWEPRAALVEEGAADAVAAAGREPLAGGGWIVLEAADGQARDLGKKLEEIGYVNVQSFPDLAGVERGVLGEWQRSQRSSTHSERDGP